jgi:ABC-type branched-subunit amino acid transport system substrate-binding protein
MHHRHPWVRRAGALALAATLGLTACAGSDDASGAGGGDEVGDVRGFDGETIRIASFGTKAQLPGAEFGVRARIERFNADAELDGVTIEYLENVDDKQDPATALTEARRLVTSENVFALVGMTSMVIPGDYLKQQKVPWFGWAFDSTYCTDEPSTDVWGFGYNGCLVPDSPAVMPDAAARPYEYASAETGEDAPTLAIFSNDTPAGQDAAKFQAVAYEGAGFDVVMADGLIPPPPVSDFTPYVQDLLTSDGGDAPDVVYCLLAADCLPVHEQLKALGFEGIYQHPVYSDLLTAQLEGTVVSNGFANLDEPSPALDQLEADMAAVAPDQALEVGSVAGYLAADMFIQALLTAAEDGLSGVTPENVQQVAANQTWEIEGLAGPTVYPDSTVGSSPNCGEMLRSNGTKWETVVEYSCTDKQWPVED